MGNFLCGGECSGVLGQGRGGGRNQVAERNVQEEGKELGGK